MDELEALLSQMRVFGVNHLLVAAAFCRRIGLIQTIDRVVPTGMAVSVGTIMQGLVLDTLSGRSPLYRLAEFFEQQDSRLLLGAELPASAFNDTTVARAMDALYEAGAGKVFSEVAYQAAQRFRPDLRTVHWDSTSVNVWGDYAGAGPGGEGLVITHGYSKDHRPDLKQFLLDVLCAGHSVPLLGGCHDGNASDKALNNALLTRISRDLARFGLGPGDWLYVADSALVTEENLEAVADNLFVTRLPFSYGEADRVVAEAVAAACWQEVGALAQTPASARRPAAQYRLAEKQVQLYGRSYRAIVVHSSAHDSRRLKTIERQIAQEAEALTALCRSQSRREYFCRADAEAEAHRLQTQGGQFHRLQTAVVEKLRHPPGRPPKDRPRPVASVRYLLQATPEPDAQRIDRHREEAGCFVLLTNVPDQGPRARTGSDLLHAYKDQHAIERNFSFLKDPLIVNDLFLKKPGRIEALGAILLISLLVWNLIELRLRQHVEQTGASLPGWDRKDTLRPTTFMMTTKFAGLQIVRLGQRYRLAQPLRDVQAAYLRALGLSVEELLSGPTGPP
jgi:transposase